MEHQFISKQNVRNLYAFINSVVQKNEDVNLDSDKKYKKIVKRLATSLLRHENNNNKSVQELNKMAVSKIGDFIVDTIKKKKGTYVASENSNNSDIKPLDNSSDAIAFQNVSSYNEDTDISLDDLYSNSIISGEVNKNEITISQTDFKSKLDSLQENRGYDEYVKNTTKFREEVLKAESIQKEQLRETTAKRSGNEFFEHMNEFGDAQADENSYDGLEVAYNNRSANEIIRTANKNAGNSSTTRTSGAKGTKGTKPKDNSEIIGLPNEFYFKSSDTDNLIKNITIKNRDFSRDNEIENYDPRINPTNLIQPIGEAAAIQPLLYENTQTGSERISKRMMVIDTGTSGTSYVTNLGTNYWYKFRADLDETMVLDKLTDVYLESLTIYGQTSVDNSMYFVIDIDKFNIQTSSNNINLRSKFVVPNNTELDFIDSNVLTTGTVSASTTTAITVDGGTATEYIRVDDSLYTSTGTFIGVVTAIASSAITMSAGTTVELKDNTRFFVGRTRTHVNKYELSSNYVCTINPTRLAMLEFTITDENNKNADDGDKYVFQNKDSTKNRIIMEFLLVSKTNVSDFL